MGTPLAPFSPADLLRTRAAALRKFATRLDNAAVCGLDRFAGADTWLGPAPNECAADLRLIRSRFSSSATTLRDAARRLEMQAAAIPTNVPR